MNLAVTLFLFVVLLTITWEDFQYRAVHWILFPLLFVGLTWLGLKNTSEEAWLMSTVANLCFLMIQFLGLWLYLTIKNGHIINPFKQDIGLGDVFLWVCIVVVFSPANFILFQVTSMFCALVLIMIFRLLGLKGYFKTVPLAGLQALILLVVLILDISKVLEMHNDMIFETLL